MILSTLFQIIQGVVMVVVVVGNDGLSSVAKSNEFRYFN
jgi:hypothetical protein